MTKPAILIFACAFGVMFAARNAVGFLTPHMAPELQLEARHLGLLSAVLAAGWALSGWLLPRYMRPQWNTHRVLAVLLVLLALDCLATTMARGFVWLLACRLLCGLAGGPLLPLIQDIVARSVDTGRRGFNMGLVQGIGGSLIAAIIAPVALVPIAEHFSWQLDFVVLAVLALCIALILHLRRATHTATELQRDPTENTAHVPAHATRNILLCSVIGSFMVTWLVLTTTFFPVYLTSIRQVSAVNMGILMAVIGAGSLCGVLIIPYLSDRFGRRLLLGVAALGALSPAALLLGDISFHLMGAMLFLGSLAGGTFPLFLAVVPSESVPQHKIASSIGVVQIACELVGGVLAPIWVGWLAVRHGLQLPVVVTLAAALAASILAAGLRLDQPRLATSAATNK